MTHLVRVHDNVESGGIRLVNDLGQSWGHCEDRSDKDVVVVEWLYARDCENE
jgi:hypothetical protein